MQTIPHGFLSGVGFKMRGERIKHLGLKRKEELEAMVRVREDRIKKIRDEYKITDKDIIELLREKERRGGSNVRLAGTYMLGGEDEDDTSGCAVPRAIPAGVVALMDAENDNMRKESNAIARLKRIIDNINPGTSFPVTLDDLEFLGL